MKIVLILFFNILLFNSYCKSINEFIIDYNTNQFLKDGQPFRYVSGSVHYFRVPSVLWYDRLLKAKQAGLNAIQTYVEWSSHEPEEGVYSFEGDNDLIKFLQIANDLGLVVILRTGPFIDAERDFGGFPYWLLSKNPYMKLRTSDPSYLQVIDKWYSLLLPKLVPMLYRNGGPVITVQIENEYGSYAACDYEYTAHLRDLHHKYFNNNVVLFTTDGDGDGYLKCGVINNVFATVDFGPGANVTEAFAVQHVHQEFGPSVNSEYYTGWLDHWEQPHQTVPTINVTKTLDDMLAANASVNLYMFHGGTSYGFKAGTSTQDNNGILPCPTSYDYDAPLNEAGDPTSKYLAIRNTIGKYLPMPNDTIPTPAPKMETKPIVLKPILNIYDVIANQTPIESILPLTFEELRQREGFILYSTIITFIPSDPAVLTVNGLRDRAQVFVNKKYAGTLSRTQDLYTLGLDIEIGSQLDLFVENQGRLCYGNSINELKGITGNVTIGPKLLKNWTHYLVFKNWTQSISDIQDISEIYTSLPDLTTKSSFEKIPTFYSSDFVLPDIKGYPFDTFLRLEGWRKGLAFLNGFNLGRYWSVGPQLTLYTPKHLFNAYPKSNKLIVFELENTSIDRKVQFIKYSILNATTPYLN